MRRRLWAPALIATRPLPGPNALTRSERFHAALAEADLSGPEPVTVGALSSHVNGVRRRRERSVRVRCDRAQVGRRLQELRCQPDPRQVLRQREDGPCTEREVVGRGQLVRLVDSKLSRISPSSTQKK